MYTHSYTYTLVAKIITLAHQKGGVGKSTLALNICAALNEAGSSSYILDMDVQGSLIDGYTLSQKSEAWQHVIVKTLDKPLSDLVNDDAAFIIIDTPPYLSTQLAEIFSVSDLVIVPCKTSLFDIRAVRSTLALIKQNNTNNKVKYGVVVNMVVGNANALNEMITDVLTGYEVKLFATQIKNRVSYEKSLFLKGSVITGDDEKAKDEIYTLTSEILDLVG